MIIVLSILLVLVIWEGLTILGKNKALKKENADLKEQRDFFSNLAKGLANEKAERLKAFKKYVKRDREVK